MKKNERFFKNFMYILRANILAQGLQFLVAPILTRLYSPDDFALLAIFSACSTLLLSIFTFRFDWSIPNAKSKKQAFSLSIISFIAVILCSILTFFAHIYSPLIGNLWPSYILIEPYIWILLFVTITSSALYIFQGWFIFVADFKESSHARFVNAIGNNIYRVIAGFLSAGASGLLWSTVFGNICGLYIQCRTLYKEWLDLFSKLSLRHLMATFKRFQAEALLSCFVSLANAISLSSIPLLIAAYYLPKEVGWYALVSRLSLAPIGLITNAVMQSFWAEAAQLIKQDKLRLRHLYLQATLKLFVLSIPVSVVCLCAPFYTGLIFGEAWHGAGAILAALTPMIIGQIVISPLTHLIVHEKQKWQLFWDIIRFIGISSLIIIGAQSDIELYKTILYVSLFSFAMYGLLFLINLYFLASQKMPYKNNISQLQD